MYLCRVQVFHLLHNFYDIFVINLNPGFTFYSRQYPALCVLHLAGTDGGRQVDEAASGIAERVTVVRPSWFQDSHGAEESVEWNLS